MFWVLFLLMAWGGVGFACERLLRAASALDAPVSPEPSPLALGPHEVAALAGGPGRVADLTLFAMHAGGRVLLAPTGWVVRAVGDGRDGRERALLAAFGSAERLSLTRARAAIGGSDAVRELTAGLGAAGLLVPAGLADGMRAAVRALRVAGLFTVAMAVASLCVPDPTPGHTTTVLWWFALPLVLVGGALAIARFEAHPYSPWATHAGRRALRAAGREARVPGADPLLRAALRGPERDPDPGVRALWRGAGRAGEPSAAAPGSRPDADPDPPPAHRPPVPPGG
ncbi:TIGR04222 domain-containing membrane protein [Streptomyces sp. BI20]|uniref:TIGR04222 domain-containing membrane protein n=1 Tax=Streptomyces sp. BI20 TaxID=3403460 RepID=UPI003C72F7BB